MTYEIELTVADRNFINACVLGTVRRAQQEFKETDAVNLTTTAAECITRLNESRMSTLDVMFINTCIEKTREYLLTDRQLSKVQRDQARAIGEYIQNKLAGIGVKRNVLEI